MIHADTRSHDDFVERRGYSPSFLAKVAAKRRQEEIRAAAEAAESKVASIEVAVASYNDSLISAAKAAMRRNNMPDWIKKILFEVGAKHGISPYRMAVGNRSAEVVRARNEAIYRVKERKPKLSLPQIGKWFGRDHTSVLHSLAKHSEETGEHKFTNYDLDRVRERNAAISARRRQERK